MISTNGSCGVGSFNGVFEHVEFGKFVAATSDSPTARLCDDFSGRVYCSSECGKLTKRSNLESKCQFTQLPPSIEDGLNPLGPGIFAAKIVATLEAEQWITDESTSSSESGSPTQFSTRSCSPLLQGSLFEKEYSNVDSADTASTSSSTDTGSPPSSSAETSRIGSVESLQGSLYPYSTSDFDGLEELLVENFEGKYLQAGPSPVLSSAKQRDSESDDSIPEIRLDAIPIDTKRVVFDFERNQEFDVKTYFFDLKTDKDKFISFLLENTDQKFLTDFLSMDISLGEEYDLMKLEFTRSSNQVKISGEDLKAVTHSFLISGEDLKAVRHSFLKEPGVLKRYITKIDGDTHFFDANTGTKIFLSYLENDDFLKNIDYILLEKFLSMDFCSDIYCLKELIGLDDAIKISAVDLQILRQCLIDRSDFLQNLITRLAKNEDWWFTFVKARVEFQDSEDTLITQSKVAQLKKMFALNRDLNVNIDSYKKAIEYLLKKIKHKKILIS